MNNCPHFAPASLSVVCVQSSHLLDRTLRPLHPEHQERHHRGHWQLFMYSRQQWGEGHRFINHSER